MQIYEILLLAIAMTTVSQTTASPAPTTAEIATVESTGSQDCYVGAYYCGWLLIGMEPLGSMHVPLERAVKGPPLIAMALEAIEERVPAAVSRSLKWSTAVSSATRSRILEGRYTLV
ncbi:hypothetical protein BDV96DRAFT_634407 [Lophiotrema nucula]|uniref:Uncharacterized protein n=1 Tax=Lophiotrema nucula TaxID=690887 RepID=A0A6A5Z045_9PLEO|nr:hypothetical protein BDV96DRAFT_634407 [Lophiotrema nucula]